MIKNVISVIDGQLGSCGKGKVIGEIATDESINLGAAVSNCMPNSGHTYVDSFGKKQYLKTYQYLSSIQKQNFLLDQVRQLILKHLKMNIRMLANI